MRTYADVCSVCYRRRRLCTRGCFRCTLSLLRTASSLPSETWYMSYVSIRTCHTFLSMHVSRICHRFLSMYVSRICHTCLSVYLSLLRTASSRASQTWYVLYVSLYVCLSIYVVKQAYVSIRQHTYISYVSLYVFLSVCVSLYMS